MKKLPETDSSLRPWNKWFALLHGVQGVAILVAATGAALPVVLSYPALNTLASETAGHDVVATAWRHVFDVRVAWLLAALFFLSATAHLAALTFWREQYAAGLGKRVNMLRWVQGAIISSLALVTLALVCRVSDAGTLIAIIGLNAILHLFGLVLEPHRRAKVRFSSLAHVVSVLAGTLPWLIIGGSLLAAAVYGAGVPGFIYWLFGSLLVVQAAMAANMYLQYKKSGRWAGYFYGEKWYIVLQAVFVTALAWQVFAGMLRP